MGLTIDVTPRKKRDSSAGWCEVIKLEQHSSTTTLLMVALVSVAAAATGTAVRPPPVE